MKLYLIFFFYIYNEKPTCSTPVKSVKLSNNLLIGFPVLKSHFIPFNAAAILDAPIVLAVNGKKKCSVKKKKISH